MSRKSRPPIGRPRVSLHGLRRKPADLTQKTRKFAICRQTLKSGRRTLESGRLSRPPGFAKACEWAFGKRQSPKERTIRLDDSPGSITSRTLLNRIRQSPNDKAAWSEFIDRYGPRIYRWCLRWNLQQADAEDVAQNVLLKLAQKMRDFPYDPARSFRAWLKTVTHHAWQDFVRAQRVRGSGDSVVQALLDNQAAPQDLEDSLDEEYQRAMLDEAMNRVRQRVEERTWQAFQRLAIEQQTGTAVAQELGMEITAAYMARSRVQKMLQEEIRRLDEAA